jgi:predicted RNA-binding Zn ribbon-like protein
MDWIFDGGRPCLDLVNTRCFRHRGGEIELLRSPAALTEWLMLAGLTVGKVTTNPENVYAATSLREAVDGLLTDPSPRTADVELINEAASTPPPPVHLCLDEDGTLRREMRASKDPVAAAFGAIAMDAINLATGDAVIRTCAADDCGVRFCDASPRRTRQWCSMTRCGNRAKARAHYARTQNR